MAGYTGSFSVVCVKKRVLYKISAGCLCQVQDPSEKGSSLKGMNLLSGNCLFPFRVDSLSDEFGLQESKQ